MRHSVQDDVYRFALTASWPRFIAVAAALFIVLNATFAALYALGGDGVVGAHSFGDLLFFSVETLSTVGFGDMVPRTAFTRGVATMEAFTSIAMVALATGIIFKRFARPDAGIEFAPRIAFGDADGSPCLMLMLANGRRGAFVDATARVWLIWQESYGAAETRRYRELTLLKSDHPVFLETWTLFHVIDASSPLYGKSEADLRGAESEFIVTFRGMDQITSQQVAASWTYPMEDTHWNGRFRAAPDLRGRRAKGASPFEIEANVD